MSSAVASVPRATSGSLRVSGRRRLDAVALVAVGVIFGLLQLVLVRPSWPLGWDETVYLSQFNPTVPDAIWAPWRAWGIPLLTAPMALLRQPPEAIRIYLVVLSATALVLAFWPWRRVVAPTAVPLAAFLYATTWFAVFFAPLAMPNPWSALGAVAAVGCFVRLPGARRRARWLVGLVGVLGAVALIRPTDSVMIALALGVGWLLVPAWRRRDVLPALAVGLAIGWVPWLVEAFLRFGGPVHRFHASAGEGGLGGVQLDPAILSVYARLFRGPAGYLTVAQAAGRPLYVGAAWGLTLVGLALLGVLTAARRRCLGPMLLAAGAAAAVAATYLVLRFGALRFLLPTLALASLPVALALVELATLRPAWLRRVGAGVAVALVAAHLVVNLDAATRLLPAGRAAAASTRQVGLAVRALGLPASCLLQMPAAVPRAYYAQCRGGTGGAQQAAEYLRKGWSVVVVTHSGKPPASAYFADWTKVRLRGIDRGVWYAYYKRGTAASTAAGTAGGR